MREIKIPTGNLGKNTLLEMQEIRIPTGDLGENILLKKQENRIPTGRKEGLIGMLYIGSKD